MYGSDCDDISRGGYVALLPRSYHVRLCEKPLISHCLTKGMLTRNRGNREKGKVKVGTVEALIARRRESGKHALRGSHESSSLCYNSQISAYSYIYMLMRYFLRARLSYADPMLVHHVPAGAALAGGAPPAWPCAGGWRILLPLLRVSKILRIT